MTESLIEQYLKKILDAVYGKDVRQSIHDAIQQCYFDGKAGSTDLEARQRIESNNSAVNERIDEVIADILELQKTGATAEVIEAKVTSVINELIADGTIANLTVADKSITKEKLSADVIEEINSAGYVVGADGYKYSVSVDESGAVTATRIYELPTDGLVSDIKVFDGKVINSVTGTEFSNLRVVDDYFIGDSNQYGTLVGTDILEAQTLTDRTIIFEADFSGGTGISSGSVMAGNGSMMYGLRWGDKDGEHAFTDNDCTLSPLPCYPAFNTNDTIRNYKHARLTKPYKMMSDPKNVFFALAVDTVKSVVRSAFYNAAVDDTPYTNDYKDLHSIYLYKPVVSGHTGAKYKRILIYNRALSLDEINIIRKDVLKVTYDDYKNSVAFTQGMTGLGSSSAFQAKSLGIPERIDTPTESGEQTFVMNEETVTFTNVDFENPVCKDPMSKFTAIYFTNPIEELKVGEVYNLEAFPYPYKINDAEYLYNVEYSTSNSEVLECYNGVLIPKSAGTAIITAKIANVDISNTISINVVEAETVDTSNYCYIPENYSSGINALTSTNPVQVLKAIRDAIYEAKRNGHNGVVFPKLDYKVKPFESVDESGNTIPIIIVPSDFTIDFNGSSFYVQDNDRCIMSEGTSYTMFSFGTSNLDGGNKVENECSNSTVKNLNYYGERYVNGDKYAKNYYTTHLYSFAFPWVGGKKNRIENIRFEGTVGYNIIFGQNGFRMWSGTSADGAVRGCMRYSDFVAGKWSADGTVLETDETGAWYSTSDFLKLGYEYSDHITKYTHMKYYKLGQMGTATRQGSAGWWYETWWYNADKELIEHNEHQMSLESYLLPQEAVYFKCAVMFWKAPTGNSATDTPHVVRFWPSLDPDQYYIDNCKFINPHAMAIAVCGGTNCVIKDCYAEQGAQFSNSTGTYGWSIDFEDGWLAMRHNVVHNLLCNGLVPNPGGYDTAYINCCINRLTAGGSANEALKIINSTIGTITCPYKTNDVYNNVTYGKMTTNVSSDVSVASVRKVNCVENTGLGLF